MSSHLSSFSHTWQEKNFVLFGFLSIFSAVHQSLTINGICTVRADVNLRKCGVVLLPVKLYVP